LIYLVDPYGNIDTGHFWKVTTDFYEALNSLNLKFRLMTPTPNAKIREFSGFESDSCLGIEQVPIMLNERNEYFVQFLKKLNVSEEKIVVIFTWLPANTVDFYEDFFSKVTNENISFFGISTLNSSSVLNYDENYSFELQEVFDNYDCCRAIWVWHEPNTKLTTGKKVRRLPEFHSNKVKSDFSEEKDYFIQLNFYGGLSGLRGLGEIFIVALFNPKLRIKIKGYGYSKYKVWLPLKFRLFRYSRWRQKPLLAIFIVMASTAISTLRFLPNVEFDSKPFTSEKEFLDAVSTSNFIFVGCKLPHSSGVALAALAAGVPVIWFGEKGEAVRTLSVASPKGRIRYKDIFALGKVTRILKDYNFAKPRPYFTWEMMIQEISLVKKYL